MQTLLELLNQGISWSHHLECCMMANMTWLTVTEHLVYILTILYMHDELTLTVRLDRQRCNIQRIAINPLYTKYWFHVNLFEFRNLMTLRNKAELIKVCTIVKTIEHSIYDSAKTYQPLFIYCICKYCIYWIQINSHEINTLIVTIF
jgi:hypothetical protein